VILRGIDPEPQHHLVEKGRRPQLHTATAVVVAGVEMQLVDPGPVVRAFQQRAVAAAISVGFTRGDQGQALILDAMQFHLDTAARTTVGGIEYVCGQTAHGHLRSVEWKLTRA